MRLVLQYKALIVQSPGELWGSVGDEVLGLHIPSVKLQSSVAYLDTNSTSTHNLQQQLNRLETEYSFLAKPSAEQRHPLRNMAQHAVAAHLNPLDRWRLTRHAIDGAGHVPRMCSMSPKNSSMAPSCPVVRLCRGTAATR